MPTPLTLVVQDVSDSSVTAKDADGQSWRIPRAAVIGVPQAGQTIRVLALSSGTEGDEQQAFARAIVAELLGQPPA